MEHNIDSLIGYNLGATDDVVGEVTAFFFEDNSWVIRYIVVKTGNWLSGRKVLIPPDALKKTAWQNGLFPVNLTKTQIEKSPEIDTDKPVSRQQETELYGHYEWENYWGSGFYAGGSMDGPAPFPVLDRQATLKSDMKDEQAKDDLHLRDTGRVIGYHVHASNGDIGHINDFIIDDKDWHIKFVVVDTHNWFGGIKVLIPVSHIKAFEWLESKLVLDITIAAVENSKLFNESDYQHLQLLKP